MIYQKKYTGENEYTEILNSQGGTTPYRHATILCETWIEKYPILKNKIEKTNGTPFEYDVLRIVENYYIAASHDLFPPHNPNDSYLQMEWWDRMLHYAIENESTIIKKLSDKMSEKEIKKIGLHQIAGEQIDLLTNETIKKEPEPESKVENMKYQKPKKKYIEECLEAIERNQLPKQIPVRECANQFTGNAKLNFLHTLIRMAKTEMETETISKFDLKRIIQVAVNILKEANKTKQTELPLG